MSPLLQATPLKTPKMHHTTPAAGGGGGFDRAPRRGNVSVPGIFCDPCPTGGLLPLGNIMDLPFGPRDISRCFDLGWVWTFSYPR